MTKKYLYNDKTKKQLRQKLRKQQTNAEILICQNIRAKKLGYKFLRQYSVGPYILDFYCAKKRLAIEIDGGQHNQEENKLYDTKRTVFLEKMNITVKRYWNHQVFLNTDAVIEDIFLALKS